MDERASAVLETYHDLIRQEREQGRSPIGAENGASGFDLKFMAVGPRSGQLINVLAASLKAPHILELGTSFGYSTLWLADAAQAAGGRVTTVEKLAAKSGFAREMMHKAGLDQSVDFHVGDALDLIAALPSGVDFVLLDLWKDLYTPCLEAFLPKLNPGAIIVADNMIRPGGEDVARYARAVRATPGMRSLLVPVGQGLEISVYEGPGAAHGARPAR